MKLERHDFDSRMWVLLREHINERIQKLRVDNDRPQNTEQQTATLRGRILELKELLALETALAQAASPDPFGARQFEP